MLINIPHYSPMKRGQQYICNVVKAIINHPPVITIDRWYGYNSQSWVVYGIVLTTLYTLWLFNIAMENPL